MIPSENLVMRPKCCVFPSVFLHIKESFDINLFFLSNNLLCLLTKESGSVWAG